MNLHKDSIKVGLKRQEVRAAYAEHGLGSKEYEASFDELHDMNMAEMAEKFRAERGLPPDAKTPYDEAPRAKISDKQNPLTAEKAKPLRPKN